MTANTGPFAPPRFTADDFARGDPTGRFDEPALERAARPRAPIEEPRSFLSDNDVRPQSSMARTGLGADPVLGSDPVMEAELDREDEILLDRPVDRSGDAFAATPVYARRTTTKRSSTGGKFPVAAMIGVPAVVLLAGVGYMAMTAGGDDAGLSTKAPGEMASSATPAPAFSNSAQVATADVAPPVNPVNPAAPAAPEARPTERVSAPVRTARARPAPAPVASASSASSEGVDASATLPAGPQPYSSVGQTSAPAPSVAAPTPSAISPAPITVPPPVTAAEPVTPAPVQEPSTPPTSTPEASEAPTP